MPICRQFDRAPFLIAAGRHVEEVKEHLGHGSIRVTPDHYGHLFPKARVAVAASLGARTILHPQEPEMEEHELRALHEQKGFSGPLLDDVVATMTADRDRWLTTILTEERQLSPISNGEITRVSVVITLATMVGHLIPLAPFLFLGRSSALVMAVALSALLLFRVGVYSAVMRVGSWWRNGIKMITIGIGAAAIGFAIGHLFSARGV